MSKTKSKIFFLVIIISGLLGWADSSMAANEPIILYTDITSGPNTGGENNNGAYLSLYGRNFGSSRGTSTVKIGGGEVAVYKVWSDTKVSVQLGSAVISGNVVLTTSNGSATAPETFTVASGNIYFVSTTGNNTTGTVNDITRPYRTVSHVKNLSAFVAGGTIVIRGGTYDLDSGNEGTESSSWIRGNKSGSAGNPMMAIGYPGETVTAKIDSTVAIFAVPAGGYNYWTVSNITGNVTTCAHSTMVQVGSPASSTICNNDPDASEGAGNIRVVNIDISGNDVGLMCGDGSGYNPVVVGYAHDVKILGLKVHSGGTPLGTNNSHIYYLSATQNNIELGWCEAYDLQDGRAIVQVHQDSFSGACWGQKFINNIKVHNTKIYNVKGQPFLADGGTGDVYFYNNLVYQSQRSGATQDDIFSLRGSGGQLNAYLYNNTAYVNPYHTSSGTILGLGNGGNGQNPNSITLYNNIFNVTESQDSYFIRRNSGWSLTNVTSNNNIWYGSSAGLPSFAGGNDSAIDPQFTNPATNNFTLQDNSPAISSGLELNATFLNDILGNIRGSVWDIGAYEYSAGGGDITPPAAPLNLAVQ